MTHPDTISSYCQAYRDGKLNEYNVRYHDHDYGVPLEDDNELFGRLILEINQAGLSWSTILKKADNFRTAYDNFHIPTVAGYTDEDFHRLKNDAGIIRNTLKINAAIHNAQAILEIQKSHGSFLQWLRDNYKTDIDEWVKLFKIHFRFVGGEIVKEFLMSIGYFPGAHDTLCHKYEATMKMAYWKKMEEEKG